MGETDIEKAKISVKTYVMSIVTVVVWVGSLCAVYFPMQAKIDTSTACSSDALKIANETREKLAKYNLEVLVYKVDELQLQVKEGNAKVDRVLTIVSGARRTER